MQINRSGLTALLLSMKPGTIVTVAAETVPQMKKRENPYLGRTKKQVRANGVINWNYETAVNNRRIVERRPQTPEEAAAAADFVAEPRAWGERMPGTPLVRHKGRLYLELKVQKAIDPTYVVDGQAVSPAVARQIESYFPIREEGARQQLNQPVVLRDYALDSIKAVVVNGQQYEVA